MGGLRTPQPHPLRGAWPSHTPMQVMRQKFLSCSFGRKGCKIIRFRYYLWPAILSIPTNKLYRDWLPGIYTEFIIYMRFIPESVFYTQSVMLSPRFIPASVDLCPVRSPQSVFYTDRFGTRLNADASLLSLAGRSR